MTLDTYRDMLVDLQEQVAFRVRELQRSAAPGTLGDVDHQGPADTVFAVDAAAEEVMEDVLERYVEEHGLSFTLVNEEIGERTYGDDPDHWVILDLVDGSREIGADLNAAYAIGGVAPGADRPTLADVEAAVQTELMPGKQWVGDQFLWRSGDDPVHRQFVFSASGVQYREPRHGFPQPDTLDHEFWCWVRPFRGAAPVIEEVCTALEDRVLDDADDIYPATHISTAAQLANLATGRYAFVADLRPVAEDRGATTHTAKPYDLASYRIFTEMSVPVHRLVPDGDAYRLETGIAADFSIDEPVAWIAYANPMVEDVVHDALCDVLAENGILS